MIFWICITIIVVASIAIPSYSSFQKQKMIEDRKTNNLALAYQIMSARPEVTIEDIQHLIEVSGGTLSLPDKDANNN